MVHAGEQKFFLFCKIRTAIRSIWARQCCRADRGKGGLHCDRAGQLVALVRCSSQCDGGVLLIPPGCADVVAADAKTGGLTEVIVLEHAVVQRLAGN